jgi:outer membrane lipopolysaccharide assembly protein LptE/RlpB
MMNNNLLFFLILPVFGLMLSCGYNFIGGSPINLPQDKSDLYITLVQDPTQEAWLEPYLRSTFQDEFSSRGGVNWVSEDQAQALVHIFIHQFRTADSLTSEMDRTVKADVTIVLEVKMLSADTGEEVWSSGNVSGRSSYFMTAEDASMSGVQGPEQRRASEEAVDQAVTRIADRLGHGF